MSGLLFWILAAARNRRSNIVVQLRRSGTVLPRPLAGHSCVMRPFQRRLAWECAQ
jgi:hypothetical protein